MTAPQDEPGSVEVVSSTPGFQGRKWAVVSDQVRLDSGEVVVRDVVQHPSAVAVVALDDADRVLLVHQYRHPVRATLWEVPAGLLDVAGEEPRAAAERELWEEAHYVADSWGVLVDLCNSPGMSDEALRIFLARGVRPADGHRHEGEGEEREMPVAWFPLDELAEGVLAGRLHNPSLVAGVLAARAARDAGWAPLREADAAWEIGPRVLR